MKCDKLKIIGKAIWEEITFWVEVLADYLEWDKGPFDWVFEQHERDVAEMKRQEEIKTKQEKYYKKD